MRAAPYPPPLQPRRKKRRKSLLLSLLGFGFGALVVMFLAGSAVGGYFLWKASRDLPSYDSLANYEPPVMTRIHAHDGSLIAEYARERRIFVPINTIPKRLIHAFLSAEDKRFYEHGGLDFQGLARAIYKAGENRLRHSTKRDQGASTITQQVAKNFLLSSDRTIERKVKEAILAIRIERAYSKDKILELYLNEIYLGIGSYGVAAAGLNYFDKELKDLTIEEVAYLAALPKAPNTYHPYRGYAKALERRNWIIGQMRDNGYISQAEAEAARSTPLKVNIRTTGAHIFAAEFFAEEVRRTLLAQYGEDKLYSGGLSVRTTLDPKLQQIGRKALVDGLVEVDRQKGWRGALQRIDVTGDWGSALGAMDVATDITPWRLGVVIDVQKAKITVGLKPGHGPDGTLVKEREAVEIPFEELKWAGRFVASDKARGPAPKSPADVVGIGDVIWVSPKEAMSPTGAWTLAQVPDIGGGLIAMDPHTGRVLAVVGGFSYAMSQFDRAIQAKRQPGSSFKPLVYAAAIDNGYKPTSIVLDAPIEIDQGPGKDVWQPKNYETGKSGGPSTLRTGVEHSRNQMTVRLAQDMGMPLITEYARRFGVYEDLLPVLSMSLGAGETTLLKLTTGYCMIANGGRQVRATLIDRIQDRWGHSVWRHDDRQCAGCKVDKWRPGLDDPDVPDDRRQVLDPHTAYQMTSILEGVIQRGTGTIIHEKLPNTPLAGKTGTTNEEKDTWFIGYSPDLVVGVFVGYDTPKPLGKGNTGGHVAAPIFAAFMKAALEGKPATPFRIPAGLKLVRVNLKSGLKAAAGDRDTLMESFKPDEEPDDAYSVIGLSEQSAGAAASGPPGGATAGATGGASGGATGAPPNGPGAVPGNGRPGEPDGLEPLPPRQQSPLVNGRGARY